MITPARIRGAARLRTRTRTADLGTRALRLIALSALLVGCGEQDGEAQDAGAAPAPAPESQAAPQDDQVVDLRQVGFDEGDGQTALIGVAEFSDFGCIYCARFHLDAYPALFEEFVVTGEVLWKYVPVSIAGFPNADLAAHAGICAGEMGAFADMRDHLFAQRDAWLQADQEGARELFVSSAAELGLEAEPFTECLEGEAAAETLERNNQVARQAGVSGTPTFAIQGQLVEGAPPLQNFQEALRRMLSQIRAGPDPAGDTTAPAPDGPDSPAPDSPPSDPPAPGGAP